LEAIPYTAYDNNLTMLVRAAGFPILEISPGASGKKQNRSIFYLKSQEGKVSLSKMSLLT
jgi:hypothetical protein